MVFTQSDGDVYNTSDSSSEDDTTEHPEHQYLILSLNSIYVYLSHEIKYPYYVANLVEHIRRDHGSPGLTTDQASQDRGLVDFGIGSLEADVGEYFEQHLFPHYSYQDVLKRSSRQRIAKGVIPNVSRSDFNACEPIPGLLYGYNQQQAFPQQAVQLSSMENEMVANSQQLIYPFLHVEFKRNTGGLATAATNQCLEGSALCVNIADRLHPRLWGYQRYKALSSCEITFINTAAFSIAMSGRRAYLYVTWKESYHEYYMMVVNNFNLQDHDDYLQFRKHVLNIIDWGRGERLEEIRKCLNMLQEENRKKTSPAA